MAERELDSRAMSTVFSRREFLWSAAATAMIGTLEARGRSASRPPNIVFILADDMGINDPAVYGQKKIHTPNIDRLAKEGLLFQEAYAGAPVCAPSRSALLTGLHTGHTRVRDNFALAGGHLGYKGKQQIRRANFTDADRTVADYLRQRGYHTGLVGKWHLDGYDSAAIPTRHGFDEFRGWLTQTESTQGYYPLQRYENETLRDIPGNQNGKRGRYETFMVTDDARDFIRRNRENPFFLYVAYSSPHSPYLAPDFGSYANEPWTRDEKTYAAMIEYMDQGIGQILETLKSSGIDENTVVFFASDNGPRSEPTPQQTEVIDFFDSNGIFKGYKRDVYEGGIHDPLIVRWPGHIAAGITSDVPAYFPDFLPTALQLAGAKPEKTDGISLVPFFFHPRKKAPDRFLYWEFYEPVFEQAVRWGRWKAVRHQRTGPFELYDLEKDPSETRNIAAQHQDVIARIEQYVLTAHVPSVEYPDPA